MAILLYYIIILFLITRCHSFNTRKIALFYLLILFCFNTQNADRDSYELMYSVLYDRSMELLWTSVLVFMKTYSLDIQYLYFIVGIPYLITIFYVIPKFSRNDNSAIACYMIALFFLDVVQLRYSFSAIFVLWAFYFLFIYDGLKSIVFYLSFIVLASLVHSSNIIFLIFAVVKIFNMKYVVFLLIGAYTTITFCLLFFADLVGRFFNIEAKIERITNTEGTASTHSVLMTSIFCILIFFMSYLAKKYHKTKVVASQIKMEFINKLAIFSLVFIPLLNLSSDFRRQIFLMFLIVCSLIFALKKEYSNRLVIITPFIVAILYFIYSTFAGNRDGVFFPIFEYNMFFNLF